MTGDQALVAALIGLCSIALALGLMAGLWTFGLRLLDAFSKKYASFELIVALGHLRGRKSGYLKIMTLVVLLAMTMANCSLPTVLSVMGGFGDDLKGKILDATAHVLVDAERPNLDLPERPTDADLDRLAEQLGAYPATKIILASSLRPDAEKVASELQERGIAADRMEVRLRRNSQRKGVRVHAAGDERSLRDHEQVRERIESIDGIVGITPFIDADVMLASQTNIAAVILKGVDPETLDSVIGLRKTVDNGNLDYLNMPEKILPDAEAEQERRLKLFLEETGLGDEDDGGISDEPEAGTRSKREVGAGNSRPLFSTSRVGGNSQRETLPAVIVGRELAKTLRVFVGDEVNVVSPLGGMGPLGPIPKARPYRVGGVFYSGMYQDDAKNAYVRLDVAQRFLGMEGQVTGLRIRVEDIEQAGEIAEEIQTILGPQYRVRSWEEVNANLFSALRLEKIAMFALYSVFFVICAFLIASTLTMMVLEKRRGIAVLKTLGASNGRLGTVFMLQGMVAGVVGTISGQVAAYVQCVALGTFVEIEPEVYYIDRLPVAIEPMEFATVAGFALLTAALATVLPLAATVVLRPVDGLRQ